MTNQERLIKLDRVYSLVECARIVVKTINNEFSDCIFTTLLTALNELDVVQEDLNNCQEERKID
jgi:hypothetical protein